MRGTWAQGIRAAVLAVTAVALLTPPVAGATIVYRHDGDIWAMNDDGSGAHALVTAAQMPGIGPWTIGDPDVLPGGGTIVFTGTTEAFHNTGAGPPSACGLNCSGTYKLVNGALTRLTAAPAPCGAPGQQWCTSYTVEPRLTADGLVAYEFVLGTWDYSCLSYICDWSFYQGGTPSDLDTQSLADGSGITKWPNSTSNGDGLAIDPLPAPDPVDPSLLAYGESTTCNSTCQFDVHVSNRALTVDRTVVYDDAPIQSLAWVPNGSALIDVEGGTQAGIWVYDTRDANTPGKNFIWLLADPKPYDASNPYSTSIQSARYLGPDKVVFDQNGDLYTVPLTGCAQRATGTAAGCTMADAHRLTSDGKSFNAVWTTQPILALGQKLPGPTPTPTPKPTVSCKVPKLGGLTVGSARAVLHRAHCALGKQHTAYSSKVKKGHIVSQSVRSGRTLKAGSKVDVTVSKGKKPKHHRRRRHH